MRTRVVAVLLGAVVSGCGGIEQGFRIDGVTIVPNDLPLNSRSTEDVKISASVYDDRHDVLEVLVRSDEALLWVDMEPGKEPKWSVSIPIELFSGYPLGDYWIDIEARDSGNRRRRLDDAVRLQIRED